jgi:hypothetical protein
MAISVDGSDSYSSVKCCELVRASAGQCDVIAASVQPVDTEGSDRTWNCCAGSHGEGQWLHAQA